MEELAKIKESRRSESTEHGGGKEESNELNEDFLALDISGYCMHHRLYPASKNFVYTLWASPFDLCEYLSWLNGIQFTRSRIERDHIVPRLSEMSNIQAIMFDRGSVSCSSARWRPSCNRWLLHT